MYNLARLIIPPGWLLAFFTLLMCPAGFWSQTLNLVAAYGFNEGVGTTVSDQSGNNNTGTLSVASFVQFP